MKNIKYNFVFLSLLLLGIQACDESAILEEVPLAFASPENSYITYSDFNAAVYSLYDKSREILSNGEHRPLDYIYGTDLGYNGANQLNVRFGSYKATLLPTSVVAEFHWQQYYKVISGANIILSRLEGATMTSAEKTRIEA